MKWALDLLTAVWLIPAIACHASRAVTNPATGLYAEQWKAWKLDHKRGYTSGDEEALRYSIWLDNVQYIEEHNQNADQHGFSLKMNSFGDLSLEEWTSFYKCHRPEEVDDPMTSYRPLRSQPYKSSSKTSSSSSLPSAFDWREKRKVTRVKNQNEYRCHSCYAFASTAALESAHAIKTGKLFSLSAQQLVDCSRMYYNAGCQGGNYRRTWMYIMENGVSSMTTYPYKSVEGTCRYKGSTEQAVGMTYYRLIQEGEDEILKTVAEQGPVLVSIDHQTRTFMFYSRGVYNNHLCNTHYSKLTHEMIVIGYGPVSGSNSTSPYWILKNSYGTGWGMDGYMYMARNKNTCGIAMDAAHPVI